MEVQRRGVLAGGGLGGPCEPAGARRPNSLNQTAARILARGLLGGHAHPMARWSEEDGPSWRTLPAAPILRLDRVPATRLWLTGGRRTAADRPR